MPANRTLTVDRLREVLDYDPETGVFRWRGRLQGRTPGTLTSRGYHRIYIDGSWWYAHRLAWLSMYGEWPAAEIDHHNGVRDDNRIANLREATHHQNAHNRHGPSRNNRTGFLGVHLRKPGRWRAQIKVNGRTRYLGLFDTPEKASAAYIAAKRQLHPFSVDPNLR